MNLNFTMVAEAAVFIALIWFAKKFVWSWLLAKIEERQKMIADGLAEAERGRSSLADAQKQTEKLLADARARAQEIVAAAEKAAHDRVEESKLQAKTEGERLVAAAQAQIQQEVQSAKQQLREQVAQLAVSGAEKILRREVDARAHADLLDGIKKQL